MDFLGILLDRVFLVVQENWLFLAVVAAAFLVRWDASWPKRLDGLAARRWVWVLIAAVSLAASLGKSWRDGKPLPQYHDDFAYLLAADTFVHGHLSYPAHPFAAHFETMHVLQQPRYAAKFPPGQGLLLMGGMTAVWLMTAAACVAIWWALRVWLGARLALLAGLAVAVHPTMLRWSQVYHGGELAAFAGALLFGAVGVMRERPGWRAAVLAGLSLGLLAITRPFEGLVVAIALATVLVISRPRIDWTYLVGALTALVALLPMAIYNRSVTGSFATFPYSIYEQRYSPVPAFLWESPRTITTWPNQEMAYNYKVVYAGYYRRLLEPGGVVDAAAKKVEVIRTALFGPDSWLASAWLLFLLPLIALPRALARRREARLLALALLLFAFAPFSLTLGLQLHYLAPAAALAAAMVFILWEELVSMRRGGLLATAVLVVFVTNAISSWTAPSAPGFEPKRQAIARSLLAQGGRHIVFVAPDVFDAVYNGGDIDGQPIVWARDLGAARDASLLAYYKHERRAWRLTRGVRGEVVSVY